MNIGIWVLFFFFLSSVVYGDYTPRTWVVDLDKPPSDRWPWKEMLPYYNQSVHDAIGLIGQFIPSLLQPITEDLAKLALPYLGEYGLEIESAASVVGIPVGTVVLLNIIYEVTAGCTSIIAQDDSGNIFHGRNLDFNLPEVLRKIAIQVQFTRNNQIVYYGTTYVGYVGLLTGMRPGAFAVSCDERNAGSTIENLLEALLVPGTNTAALLVRSTLERVDNFDEAVSRLSIGSLAAPIYIIVSGPKPGQGVVITRDRYVAADVWYLSTVLNRWYLVETNWDHWEPAGDNRRATAVKGMNSVGQDHIDLQTIYDVLSTHPVINSQTTYTTLMSSASGNYSTVVREYK